MKDDGQLFQLKYLPFFFFFYLLPLNQIFPADATSKGGVWRDRRKLEASWACAKPEDLQPPAWPRFPQPGWETPAATPSAPLPEGCLAMGSHFNLLEWHRTHLMLIPLLFLLTDQHHWETRRVSPAAAQQHQGTYLLNAPHASTAKRRPANEDQNLSSYSRQDGGHPEMPSAGINRKFVAKSTPC